MILARWAVEVSEWYMARKECALQNEKLRVSKNKL
jgi:hypothetical protein